MDAGSTEAASLPPLQINLSSSLPGSSVPIRAPLTIDSDSDSCLSVHDLIYSRTSSFNSCSSIDISSYGDEHTSVLEEEDSNFVAYPDEEIVIESTHVEKYSFSRPFLRYPDVNSVNESSAFKESTIFRPSVKSLCEESSSADIGIKLGVPIAPLTSDCDSDTDVDSVDGRRWLDSGRIPADRNMRKVFVAPKVRIFDGDEGDDEVDELQVEGVFSGDDIGMEELDSVSAKLIEDEGCKLECLNEVKKLSELDEMSIDLEKTDAQILSSSNNAIEVRTINVKLSESDESSFDLESIDAQVVSSLNNETDVETINVKRSESDELSSDLERIDTQINSELDNEIETKTIGETEQEVVFDSNRNESKKAPREKEDEIPVKTQPIRAKFFRIAFRKQVTTEVKGEDVNSNLDFDLTILAIGKTGVGKSATINSIFGEHKALTNAFNPGTTTIQEIIGNVDGIQLRVIDTPGLKCSSSDQSYNLNILRSIKRFTQKHIPDVVLYVDRLDTHTREDNDSQHVRLITSSLGSSFWGKCVIALTHATSNPPDEPLEEFVKQRCRFIQEKIVRHGGNNQLMANPAWLVENHPFYANDSIDLDENECDYVPMSEPLSESQYVNHSLEHKSLFQRVQLSLKLFGNRSWRVACQYS